MTNYNLLWKKTHNKFQLMSYLEYKFQLKMEHLLNSRLSRDQSPAELQNLSPQKFGKGAYACLTYTPSKLADNVLYKDALNSKKIEAESRKLREDSTLQKMYKDDLEQKSKENRGMENLLSQQIQMYKDLLEENRSKNRQRLLEQQRSFSQERQKIILSKEEEAKYAQSQKELLEGRINELENEVSELREQLEHGTGNFDQLTKNHEKLEISYKNVCEKLEESEKRAKEESQKAKQDYEELSRRLYNSEIEFKGQLERLQFQREKEKEGLERLHKVELQKIENKRLHEAMVKSQELKDLTSTFEAEANRLRDIVANKERNIETLNNVINDEKEKYIKLTKNSTEEITNLIHEKNRYKEEVDTLHVELAKGREIYKDLQKYSEKEIANKEAIINKLKDEIDLNQSNFNREKDQLSYVIDDLHHDNVVLKSENDRFSQIANENIFLCKEIRNLKDLLLESSLEMEKCKEEFIRIGREKDLLSVRVRELDYENESLHRMKIESEEEARGWKESYYLSRR